MPERHRRPGLILGAAVGSLVLIGLDALGVTRLLAGDSPTPPQVVPTVTVTQAPPEVGYTCWDGRSAADLAVCGTPSGRAGLLYAFPSLANALDSCELGSPRITHRPGTTSYRCVGPDGTVVLYRYWTAGSDGLAHLDETYADSPVRSDLILDGQVAGFLCSGRLTTGAYNATACLQNGHFTASAISVNSSEERDYGSAAITFRSPADANGHPANAYPRVAIRD